MSDTVLREITEAIQNIPLDVDAIGQTELFNDLTVDAKRQMLQKIHINRDRLGDMGYPPKYPVKVLRELFPLEAAAVEAAAPAAVETVKISDETNERINAAADKKFDDFIKTASYTVLEELVTHDNPVNIYISGDTGLGKSTAVMFIARRIGLPVVRVSMTFATDVDDLIGGIRLEGGDTTFKYGPVIECMQTGGILLLDEVDSANPRVLMELQAIAEGNGVLIKKTNTMVYPHPTFRIIATGNTAGRGDTTGRFVGTGPLNAAFLDRFAVHTEFLPPTRHEMMSIIDRKVAGLNQEVVFCLAAWYEQIAKAHAAGASTEGVSTRRTIEIAKLFRLFKITDPETQEAMKAVNYGVSMYDSDQRAALVKLWDNMINTTRNDRRSNKTAKPGAGKSSAGGVSPTDLAALMKRFATDENGAAIPFK